MIPKKLVKFCEYFGLNNNEIKIYFTLLKEGNLSIRKLARATNLNRGSTYEILKRLESLDFVRSQGANTRKSYFPNDPEVLADKIDSHKKELATLETDIKSIMPQLKTLFEDTDKAVSVQYFEGQKGIKAVLNDIFKTLNKKRKKEYYVYSAKEVRQHIYQAYPEFTKERIEKKIKVKSIAIGSGGSTTGLDERKWLSSKEPKDSSYTFIYIGKVAHIFFTKEKKVISVIIENPAIYETQKLVFEQLWGQL